MSTNLSKQDENTRNLLTYLSELEKEISVKKFDLVFEKHRKGIDETFETHTSVLTENRKLFIDNGGREVEDYTGRQTFQVPRSLIAPYRPEKLQAVTIAGDSMTRDNMHSGDIVIFYPELLEGKGIYAVSVENSLLVKKVSHDPYRKTIDLISSNEDYPVRHYEGPELADIRIAGKVIAVFHRV